MENKIKSNATKAEIKDALEQTEAERIELANEKEALENKLQEKDSLFEQQMKQMQDMQNMILQLQSTMLNQNNNSNSNNGLEETVGVKSFLIGKHNVSIDASGANDIIFAHTGAVEDVTLSDAQSLIKFGKNKKLFVNGLVIFEDEDNYERFRIKPRRLLTDEYIINLFGMEGKDFIKELTEVTQNKKIPSIVHNLVYRAGLLFKNRQLGNINPENMYAFKDFFGAGLLELQVNFLED